MDIPKEKLSVISLSVKVNRKARYRKTKAAKWTQNRFAKGICSQNTMISIERGNPTRFIEFYDGFAERLEMKFGYHPEIDKEINKIIPKLFKSIDFYKLGKIKAYSEEIITLLEPAKTDFWYHDLYVFMLALQEYYDSNKDISKEEIAMYIDMIGEFPESIDELLRFFIFTSTYNDLSNNDVKRIYELLNMENSDHVCVLSACLLYYYMMNKTVKYLKLSSILIDRCIATKNYTRLVEIYGATASFLSYYDPDELNIYLVKANDLIESADIPLFKKAEYYYNVGSANYECSHYKEALDSFLKCYEYDEKKNVKEYIMIASCQRFLNGSIHIPFYVENELKCYSEDDELLYEYFSMCDEVPSFVKQRFLMDKVLPKIQPGDEMALNIIKSELTHLINDTNHYKDSIIFEVKAKELLED